jgi:hypothetical protein
MEHHMTYMRYRVYFQHGSWNIYRSEKYFENMS